MKLSIILCLIFCLSFFGNDVGSINCRMGELLESNIINKKSGADVVLTLDGSVSDTEFMQQKEAAKLLCTILNNMAKISSRKSGIGLIQYSEKKKTQTEIVLGTLSSLKEIKARIDRVEQLRGTKNNIGGALFNAYGQFKGEPAGDRSRIVVLVTNGKYKGRPNPFKATRRLKKHLNASVIVVGIGISKKRDIEELQKIATGRKNYMGFPTFKEYLKDVEKLTL